MSQGEDKSKLKSSIAITHEVDTILFRKGQHFSNSIFSQRNKVEIITLQGENRELTMTRHFVLNENNKLTRITRIYNKNQLATITDTIQVFQRPRDSFVSPRRAFQECEQTSFEDPCLKNIVKLFKDWLLESRQCQRAFLQLQKILQQQDYTYQLIQSIAKSQILREAFLDFQTGAKRAIARAKLPNKREHSKTLKNCVQLIKMEEIIMKPEGGPKIIERTKKVLLTMRGVERTFKNENTPNNTQE